MEELITGTFRHFTGLSAQQPEEAEAKPLQPLLPPKRGRQRRVRPGEEPLEFFPPSAEMDSIVDFFGINPKLPVRERLVMRLGTGNQIGARRLYFVGQGRPQIRIAKQCIKYPASYSSIDKRFPLLTGVKDVLLKDEDNALKVMAAGLKVFERNDKRVRIYL